MLILGVTWMRTGRPSSSRVSSSSTSRWFGATRSARVRFHDLRHSYGTAMAGAGCPMFELAGYMGHASVTTTEKHYAAWSPDEVRGAIYAERAFAPATPNGTPN